MAEENLNPNTSGSGVGNQNKGGQIKRDKLFLAVIFDMDGVLVDSEHWWAPLQDKFFTELVGQWNEKSRQGIMGRSLKDIHSVLQTKYGLKMGWLEFADSYGQRAKPLYQKQCNLMPGLPQVLDRLKQQSLKLALASSSFHSWIEIVLERFALKKYFEAVVSAEDVGLRGKPAPDIYFYTAQRLQVKPRECIVIEDSTNGILSAKASGMTAVGYQTPFNSGQDLKRADEIIKDLNQILNLIS